MTTQPNIVITGLGLVSCLGITPEDTFDAVLAGRCGIGPMPALEQTPSPNKGGGQAADLPIVSGESPAREVRYLRYTIRHAMLASGEHPYLPSRVAAVLGTTLHGMRAGGEWLRSGDVRHLYRFPAGAVLDEALRNLRVEGSRISTCSACSSGLGAIALAVTLLRSGDADMVIAGGYDTVSEYVYAGFDSLRLVAEGPPRPFSAARDGMKPSEGYGVVVVERETDAHARGARIRGYVAGFGESADAHHLTQPHPRGEGARAAIGGAIESARIEPHEIGLISAHATATPDNDAAEHAALEGALGRHLADVPVVAFKANIGHTLGGAGAIELVLSVLARERGVIPPTQNALPLDPRLGSLRLNHEAPESATIGATLNLSLGFGGANTCVITTTKRPVAISHDRDEAVITGIGVVLPGCVGLDRFIDMLRAAPGGCFAPDGHIEEDSIAHLLQARRVRRMSGYVKATLAATRLACDQAGIADATAVTKASSVVLGTMHGSAAFCETYYSQVVREGIAAANPVLFAEGVPNAAAAHLSLSFDIRGACQTIIGSRNAGLDALRLASMRIREGVWTRAFVGAGEEHSDTVNAAERACSGSTELRFGAGAVTLVVEGRRAAAARGARVLGTVVDSWSTAAGTRDLARAVERTRSHTDLCLVATSLGAGPLHGPIRRRIDESAGTRSWHTSDLLPECFSVGGLAAVAGVLLAPVQSEAGPASGASVLVVSTAHNGGATGVVVRG